MKKDDVPVANNQGSLMKTLRDKAGLSQRQVSDAFGWTTPQFVSNIERGLVPIPPANMKKFAQLYGVSVKVLIECHLDDYKRRLLHAVHESA